MRDVITFSDDCEYYDENEETENDMINKKKTIQEVSEYHTRGGCFVPSMPVSATPKLPAGVYKVSQVGFDLGFQPVSISTDTLIRSGNSSAKEVISEIDRFWTLEEKYRKYGFIHKRGFLLHGPPGTGKTSTLNHVMSDTIEKDGVVIMAPEDPNGLSLMLTSFRAIEPTRQLVVVMEDLDNLLRFGESQLLALLDGDTSIGGVVYIATTNYLSRIPERISNRPSRFDKIIEIGAPNAEMRREYLKSRGVCKNDLTLDLWVRRSKGLSMAHLKELIVAVSILDGDLEAEIKRLRGKDLTDE